MNGQASKDQLPLPRRTSTVVVGIVGLIAAAAGLTACPTPDSTPTAHPTLSYAPDTGPPATTPVTTARPTDDLGIRPLDCLPYNPNTLQTVQGPAGGS
jgi:hypothetical protein